jgi:hypothetical protein
MMAASAARSPVVDPDVFWIAAAGRQMVRARAVLRENTFSFVDTHHPWVMHEWLLALPYALGYGAWGPAFFAAVAVLLATAGSWLVLSVMREPAALLAGTVALFLYGDRLLSARPIAFSQLFALLMIGLVLCPRLSARWAVAIEWLWANAHGSFPLGLVILSAGVLNAPREGRKRAATTLAAATLATLVNPYGWKLHALVADYSTGFSESARLIREHVLEFSPVWRSDYHVVVGPLKVGGLAVLAVLAALALREPARRIRAGLTLVLVLAALLLARQVDLAGLCGAVLLFGGVRRPFVIGTAVALSAGFVLMALLPPASWIDPSLGGAPFARLVDKLPDGAKVYVPFRDGGLLLALGAQRGIQTFYDSRNDCYSPETMRVALALKDGEVPDGGVARTFERFGVEFALVPAADYVERAPAYDARWRALAVVPRALSHWPVFAADDGWTILRYTPAP